MSTQKKKGNEIDLYEQTWNDIKNTFIRKKGKWLNGVCYNSTL